MDLLSCWKVVNTLLFLHKPPELPEEIVKCWPNIIDIVSGKAQAIFSFFGDPEQKIGNAVNTISWRSVYSARFHYLREKVIQENPHLQGDNEAIEERAVEAATLMIARLYFFRPLDIVVLEQTSCMKKLAQIIAQEKMAYLVFRFSLYYGGDFGHHPPYHFDIYKDFVCLYYVLSNRKLAAAVAEKNWQKVKEAIKELNDLEYFKWQKIIPLNCP